ncbi:MAG: hypothetical protein OIN86_13030 [Candidatus Methanoperedens sp.]|nr:hypothetical protein [Candidatus Methanoperedens sp.]CAG0948846.1 hypothetical protein METP1_00061 [Methanosarcinales archaeon]
MKNTTLIAGIILLIMAFAFMAPEQFKNLTGASFISYSSSVPVQIGYDTPSNFWVLTATVGWSKDVATLIKLPSGSTDNSYKTQASVDLTLTPKGSYDTASLTKNTLKFKSNILDSCPDSPCNGASNYYQVEGANWKTTTMYDVSLNGQTQSVKVGMDYPADISLGRGAFIKNIGQIGNGANAPSGEFILVLNPDPNINKYEFYRYNDVMTAISAWNNHFFVGIGGSSWTDVWNWLKANNKLPPKPVMTAKSYTFNPSDTSNYGTIQMNYDLVARSSFITIYIPSSLANTILIKIGASKAFIVSKTDFELTEGTTGSFTVTVRNDGGDDYVTVKGTSQYYMVSPVTEFMTAGSTKVFTLRVYGYDITGDKSGLPVSVTADGTDPYNGDSIVTVYGTTHDTGNAVPTGTPTGTGTGTVITKKVNWYETTSFYILVIILTVLILTIYRRKVL